MYMKNEDLLLMMITTMPSYKGMSVEDKEIYKGIAEVTSETLLETYSTDLSDLGLAYIEVLNIYSRVVEFEELEVTTTKLLSLRDKTEVLSMDVESFSDISSQKQVEMLIPYMLRAGVNPVTGYDNIYSSLIDAVLMDNS